MDLFHFDLDPGPLREITDRGKEKKRKKGNGQMEERRETEVKKRENILILFHF